MTARPMRHGLYMGRPENYVGWPVGLTGQPMGRLMCCPVLKGAYAYADVFFNVDCCFFVIFSRLDSVGQLLSANETHNSAPPTTQSDGFLVTTTSSCCSNARNSSKNSSSMYVLLQHPVLLLYTLLQHPVLLLYTLLQHPLSNNDNASTSRNILAAVSHVTAAAVPIPGSASTHMKMNVAATFGQKISPVWACFMKLHRRFRPRDEPGQERHPACVAEMARSVVCTPTTVPRL